MKPFEHDYFVMMEGRVKWARLVERISLGHHPFNFHLSYDVHQGMLGVHIHTIDSNSASGQSHTYVAFTRHVGAYRDEGHAIRMIRDVLLEISAHEVDEFFKLDDAKPFDPHKDDAP